MSMIEVSDLSFCYDKSYDDIFSHTSFLIDTDWKLGLTGRNGRGKTTFLKLLMGEYEYKGSIKASVRFDYFPFAVSDMSLSTLTVIKSQVADFSGLEAAMQQCTQDPTTQNMKKYGELLEQYEAHDGFLIDELVSKEISKLDVSKNVLDRPFSTLSNGERTKVLLAALFLKHNNFLLIDEPTNHLDLQGREIVSRYLREKKSFLLVSHDRVFLDSIIDHILVINRTGIEVQQGNFSSWQENKRRQDSFELSQNEKLKVEITRLTATAKQTAEWSDKLEATKIGTHAADRGAIGHKAAKMMKRSRAVQNRREASVEEKKSLLKNVEYENTLKLSPLRFQGRFLVQAEELSIDYGDNALFDPLTFSLSSGERVWLAGKNGSGKSSLLKLIADKNANIPHLGNIKTASNLVLSYVKQDTSALLGGLSDYAEKEGIDESLFKTILIKLDFKRIQFEKDIADFSEGQKKKVLLAASLAKPAHIYIWDEPLNFIDILSREQILELILSCEPTLLFVEHDKYFSEQIATRKIILQNNFTK